MTERRRYYMVEGLSERIESIYAKTGLTQREFARRIGVRPETLREWLTGRTLAGKDMRDLQGISGLYAVRKERWKK